MRNPDSKDASCLPDETIKRFLLAELPIEEHDELLERYRSCPQFKKYVDDSQKRLFGDSRHEIIEVAESFFDRDTLFINKAFKKAFSLPPEMEEERWTSLLEKIYEECPELREASLD